MAKECYQLEHPDKQTDCFKLAGRVACSKDGCPVKDAIATSALLRSFIHPADRQSFIECNLLHQACRMSNMSSDNEEYLKLTEGKKF